MKKRSLTALIALSLICLLASPGPTGAQDKPSERKVITPTDQPANSPFSPALLVGDTLYISGQLGMDPETGKLAGETMTAQAERVIKNIEILCKRAGMDLSRVVETTVFITDFNEFAEFNAVYRKLFPTNPPTRATVQVVKLAMSAKIEMSAVAVK
ncbi:MAG: RidA family protein [Candidatus Aminicenantales bacterium]